MLGKRLQKGDTIGLVAPSKPIDNKELVENFIKKMEDYGLKCKVGSHVYDVDKYGCSAGTPEQRAGDINSMFADPETKAIWCIQGGSVCNSTLDLLDYDMIKKNPKLFIGKSDIDVLLMALNKKTGLIGFHAPDAKLGRDIDFDYEYSQNMFVQRLMMGEYGEIESTEKRTVLRDGSAEGRIIGCNLNAILKLAGTDYFPDMDGAILFLEAYRIQTKHVLFRLQQLKHMGVFEKIRGVVVGHILSYDNQEQYNSGGRRIFFEQIVMDIVEEYKFPVLKCHEFGHYCPNFFVPIGGRVSIQNSVISLLEPVVR